MRLAKFKCLQILFALGQMMHVPDCSAMDKLHLSFTIRIFTVMDQRHTNSTRVDFCTVSQLRARSKIKGGAVLSFGKQQQCEVWLIGLKHTGTLLWSINMKRVLVRIEAKTELSMKCYEVQIACQSCLACERELITGCRVAEVSTVLQV